jgi:acyl carrier protein
MSDIETALSDLETAIETVRLDSVREDCATITAETDLGRCTVEFGDFERGDETVLNFAMGSHPGYTEEMIESNLGFTPVDSGTNYAIVDVSGLDSMDIAETIIDGLGSWQQVEIEEIEIRRIETDNRLIRWINSIRSDVREAVA